MAEDEYHVPPLAKFFHALPHLNVSLHRVNNTFDPDSEVYLESLGILGSVPAAWLILTLLVLLVYLLTRCCDRRPRARHSIAVLKWVLALFTLLCCGAVGVGLYGNDDVHNGVVQFVMATRQIDEIIGTVSNQTQAVEMILTRDVQPLLSELDDLFDTPILNQTIRALLLGAMGNLKGNTTTANASIHEISRPLDGVDVKIVIHIVQTAELIRWPATMGLLSLLLLLCLVLLFGVARHSRCALIAFSVLGLFAVIVSFVLSAVYLAGAVALGDLCVAPERFLTDRATTHFRADVLRYYLRCEATGGNPFNQRLQQGQRAMKSMAQGVAIVTRNSEGFYPASDLHPKLDILTKNVNQASQLVSGMATALDCHPLQRQYLRAASSVCDLGLYGLTFMLLASVAAGLFFTVLVWVDSHTWIYIRKRRDYLQVDEQDPFLPPSAASQAIAARTLRNQGDGRRERDEKSQHGAHHGQPSSVVGGHEYGASTMPGPNHVSRPLPPIVGIDQLPSIVTFERQPPRSNAMTLGRPQRQNDNSFATLGRQPRQNDSFATLGRQPRPNGQHEQHLATLDRRMRQHAVNGPSIMTLERRPRPDVERMPSLMTFERSPPQEQPAMTTFERPPMPPPSMERPIRSDYYVQSQPEPEPYEGYAITEL